MCQSSNLISRQGKGGARALLSAKCFQIDRSESDSCRPDRIAWISKIFLTAVMQFFDHYPSSSIVNLPQRYLDHI